MGWNSVHVVCPHSGKTEKVAVFFGERSFLVNDCDSSNGSDACKACHTNLENLIRSDLNAVLESAVHPLHF